MTPEDKAYYSDGYYPLFKLMSDEFGLTLLEQDMSEIMNCVRKMDEVQDTSKEDFINAWMQKAYNWDAKDIAAQYIVKMIQAKYDYIRIIFELATIMNGLYDRMVKKIEMEPPAPIYIDPKSYTIPQLEQLLAIKIKQEGGE